MQNKKPLLQRLLVIYITFFIVLVASVAHGILPNFTRGAAEGVEMGNDIAEKWKSGIPRMIYMLSDIQITGQPGNTLAITSAPGVEISASVKRLGLIVEQDAPGASPLGRHSARWAAAHGFTHWLCSYRCSTWGSSC